MSFLNARIFTVYVEKFFAFASRHPRLERVVNALLRRIFSRFAKFDASDAYSEVT